MSVDKLQKQIRVMKNPSSVLFSLDTGLIPPAYTAAGTIQGYCLYVKELLTALKQAVPAVRFDFGSFAVFGHEGIDALTELLGVAAEQGYYVILSSPEISAPGAAEVMAVVLFQQWQFDGLVLNCYMGSDIIKPFADQLKATQKDLFLLLRTANKSASELQDLLTGSRLVYHVAADLAKRLGEGLIAPCGYSRIAGVGPAVSADALSSLRTKYPALFLLVDGYDFSGANAKICSAAFDKLGHGAVVCAGESIVGAWREAPHLSAIDAALQAVERMKKNICRYITVL